MQNVSCESPLSGFASGPVAETPWLKKAINKIIDLFSVTINLIFSALLD